MSPDELNERSKKTACWSGLDFAVERIEKLEARVAELEKSHAMSPPLGFMAIPPKRPRPANHQGEWQP